MSSMGDEGVDAHEEKEAEGEGTEEDEAGVFQFPLFTEAGRRKGKGR